MRCRLFRGIRDERIRNEGRFAGGDRSMADNEVHIVISLINIDAEADVRRSRRRAAFVLSSADSLTNLGWIPP